MSEKPKFENSSEPKAKPDAVVVGKQAPIKPTPPPPPTNKKKED